jgi:hypothetical protein
VGHSVLGWGEVGGSVGGGIFGGGVGRVGWVRSRVPGVAPTEPPTEARWEKKIQGAHGLYWKKFIPALLIIFSPGLRLRLSGALPFGLKEPPLVPVCSLLCIDRRRWRKSSAETASVHSLDTLITLPRAL